MSQDDINEHFIMTLDPELNLYYKTILNETWLNLGLQTGGTKERDLKFVQHRYDIIVQKKDQVPELKKGFGLFNFEE